MSRHAPTRILLTLLSTATLAVVAVAPAAGQAEDVTLASIGEAKVTLADYEASILRIPEIDRLGWAMSQERINKEIENLLRIRAIASEAKRMELGNDQNFKARVTQYAERLLSEAVGAKIDADSAKEFAAKRAAFLERAREQYLVNKHEFQTPAEVKVSHILVDLRGRTAEEALARINALRARALAGESFETLAESNSDDPSARQNKGSLEFFGSGRMDPAFEAAAFALKKPGELSEPIKTRFGYHLIRLEAIKPGRQFTFEEASADLMEKLKAQYVATRREQVIRTYYDSERVKWNEPAIVGLKKTVDPAVFKIPTQ